MENPQSSASDPPPSPDTTWVNRIRFDAQGHRLTGAAVPDRTVRNWDATPCLISRSEFGQR